MSESNHTSSSWAHQGRTHAESCEVCLYQGSSVPSPALCWAWEVWEATMQVRWGPPESITSVCLSHAHMALLNTQFWPNVPSAVDHSRHLCKTHRLLDAFSTSGAQLAVGLWEPEESWVEVLDCKKSLHKELQTPLLNSQRPQELLPDPLLLALTACRAKLSPGSPDVFRKEASLRSCNPNQETCLFHMHAIGASEWARKTPCVQEWSKVQMKGLPRITLPLPLCSRSNSQLSDAILGTFPRDSRNT